MDKNPPFAIRLATPDDAEVIVKFSTACALESEGIALEAVRVRAGVETALGDPLRGHYYLAEDAAGAAGQVMITREWSDWRNAWIWWLQSVYVRADARRRGVFRALLEHAEAAAHAENAAFLRLYVATDNAPAERTYLNEGFVAAHYRMLEKRFPAG